MLMCRREENGNAYVDEGLRMWIMRWSCEEGISRSEVRGQSKWEGKGD